MAEIKVLKGVKPNDIIYAYKGQSIVAYKVVKYLHNTQCKNIQLAYDYVVVISAMTQEEETIKITNNFFNSIEECILQKNPIETRNLNKHDVLKTLRSQGYDVKINEQGYIIIKTYYMSFGKVSYKTNRVEFDVPIELTYTDEDDVELHYNDERFRQWYKTALDCAKDNEFTIYTF